MRKTLLALTLCAATASAEIILPAEGDTPQDHMGVIVALGKAGMLSVEDATASGVSLCLGFVNEPDSLIKNTVGDSSMLTDLEYAEVIHVTNYVKNAFIDSYAEEYPKYQESIEAGEKLAQTLVADPRFDVNLEGCVQVLYTRSNYADMLSVAYQDWLEANSKSDML